MKKLFGAITMIGSLVACQEHEAINSEFTGNESVYPLMAGSTYPIHGTVTFKEKNDGSALVLVAISGTEGDIKHPVHLHLGNISSPDAAVSALLDPVLGKTGLSETHLTRLADESPISYAQLVDIDACIKVHLAEAGPDKNIILAGGNIGKAAANDINNGRAATMSVCQSE
ncbi:MAG: hypothetical protein ACOYXT_16075 [Bacteroidota bacterium]